MSFIFKQMLNNINTDIEALQLEDINIGLGGTALGESITNLTTALGDEVARAVGIESGIVSDIGILTTIAESAASTSSTNAMQGEIDAIKPFVGINNVFSMIKTNQDIPLNGG